MHKLIYNGVDLYDHFKCLVYGDNQLPTPERDVENITIPGRNGDLHKSQDRFRNQEIPYNAKIADDCFNNYDAMRAFLMSGSGYKELYDSKSPDYFRLAVPVGMQNPEVAKMKLWITFSLVFDVDPRRFLREGKRKITLTASGKIKSPVLYGSNPLIRMYGTGSMLINDQLIEVTSNVSTGILLDCDSMNAEASGMNANSAVKLPIGKITIPAGVSSIGINGLSKVEIVPRWWTI